MREKAIAQRPLKADPGLEGIAADLLSWERRTATQLEREPLLCDDRRGCN
jgi:hypothetical protein